MRSDIAKVLTEHERSGSWKGYHDVRRKNKQFAKDFEDLPDKESIKKRYVYDTKSFSDHLSPLYGFLRKSVGRPWDKVYSELATKLDRRSVAGFHVWSHVKGYVATSIVAFNKRGAPLGENYYPLYQDFYVDPKTGLLKKTPEYEVEDRKWYTKPDSSKKKDDKLIEFISDFEAAYHEKGIWYLIRFRKLEESDFVGSMYQQYQDGEVTKVREVTTKKTVYDKIFGTPFSNIQDAKNQFKGHAVTAISKKQMNTKEKKKLVTLYQ